MGKWHDFFTQVGPFYLATGVPLLLGHLHQPHQPFLQSLILLPSKVCRRSVPGGKGALVYTSPPYGFLMVVDWHFS